MSASLNCTQIKTGRFPMRENDESVHAYSYINCVVENAQYLSEWCKSRQEKFKALIETLENMPVEDTEFRSKTISNIKNLLEDLTSVVEENKREIGEYVTNSTVSLYLNDFHDTVETSEIAVHKLRHTNSCHDVSILPVVSPIFLSTNALSKRVFASADLQALDDENEKAEEVKKEVLENYPTIDCSKEETLTVDRSHVEEELEKVSDDSDELNKRICDLLKTRE